MFYDFSYRVTFIRNKIIYTNKKMRVDGNVPTKYVLKLHDKPQPTKSEINQQPNEHASNTQSSKMSICSFFVGIMNSEIHLCRII